MNSQHSANDSIYTSRVARSMPVLASLTPVHGYPSKLKIYRIAGSRFWQVRCFMSGRMHVRSLRTIDKSTTTELAKRFYEELLVKHNQDDESDIAGLDRIINKRVDLQFSLEAIAKKALEVERGRMLRGELALQSFKSLRSRFMRKIYPFFQDKDIRTISHKDLAVFVKSLSDSLASTVTISQYMQSVRLIFKFALVNNLVDKIPPFPKIKIDSQPRGGFTASEYLRLLRAAKSLAKLTEEEKPGTHRDRAGGIFTKTASVPMEMAWVIGFMVNSFMRPTDLKFIQHKHVEIVRGEHLYLRLTLPETKRHKAQIVTLRPAVRIYQSLLRYREKTAVVNREDYLFLPHIEDRDAASVVLSMNFNKILSATGLKLGELGQARSLYSLRHTAIMFRLLYGKGIDLLTLARNARTSVQMIEEFYASNLTAEMNIGLLQSKRGGVANSAVRRG